MCAVCVAVTYSEVTCFDVADVRTTLVAVDVEVLFPGVVIVKPTVCVTGSGMWRPYCSPPGRLVGGYGELHVCVRLQQVCIEEQRGECGGKVILCYDKK